MKVKFNETENSKLNDGVETYIVKDKVWKRNNNYHPDSYFLFLHQCDKWFHYKEISTKKLLAIGLESFTSKIISEQNNRENIRYFYAGFIANIGDGLRAGSMAIIYDSFPTMIELIKEVEISHPDASNITILSVCELSEEDFKQFNPTDNG
jgi:hypothetical protein